MESRKISAKQTAMFYWRHAWRYPQLVLGTLVSVPVTILVYNFLPPLILADVLDRLGRGDFQHDQVWQSFGPELVWYAVLLMLGGAVLWRAVDIFIWVLESRVTRDIANRVFGHLMDQSANFHANHFGGSMVSQTNKLIGSYVRSADTTVFSVLPLLASIVFAVAILVPRAPIYSVCLLLFSIGYMVMAVFITRRVRLIGAELANIESKQTGYLADAITNVMAIKSFAGGQFERKQFYQKTLNSSNHLLKLMTATQKQQFYFGAVNNAIGAMSLLLAVIAVMLFGADIGTVFLIFTYTTTVTVQLWEFGTSALRAYNRSVGDAQDMINILDIEPEVKDPLNPQAARINNGTIDLNNVDFTHPDSSKEEVLFNNLSLHIKAGEKIGLVGHSGSGKTTLTRILLRFNDIDGGKITIDGQDIAQLTQDDLRRNIAYVPQEPLLFHRTIRENIAYGKPSATDAEIRDAAQKAFADGFIQKLPKGYNTLVGERGVKLSGGQRQRIAIARAMLKDAPILVLDEATSALDSESEKLIQAALWELMKGRTAIVIAHRLSTIQKMDRIIVLDEGKIMEEGSHQQLLKKKGTYAKLWAHQSGGFLDD